MNFIKSLEVIVFFVLKPRKLTFSNFGNLRKKKQEDGEEYVCPMELGQASGSVSKKGPKAGLEMRLYDEDDLDRLEQVSATLPNCFQVLPALKHAMETFRIVSTKQRSFLPMLKNKGNNKMMVNTCRLLTIPQALS